MEFKLDKDAMEALVHKAIFDSMTPEKRDELLMQSIRKLTEISKDGYSKTSPMTDAFQNAARRIAEEMVKTELETNEKYQQHIKKLFFDVVDKLFASEFREKLIDNICNSVISGLNNRY